MPRNCSPARACSEVVTQLSKQDPSRLVLFDSAPLLLTTESPP